MNDLSADFHADKAIALDLKVPALGTQALQLMVQITGARNICIAGGFARGLYMQQNLKLNPQMNDIDIFADLSPEEFYAVEERLKAAFGAPVRFHVGTFEKEEFPRGLVEFALPQHLRAACAGVESIQLNFGTHHPWASAFNYIQRANVGMNQIAILSGGDVIATQLFIDDMTNRTMTMNASRHWTAHDWARTTKKLERIVKERPEFEGWKPVLTAAPHRPVTGFFWNTQKPALPRPV